MGGLYKQQVLRKTPYGKTEIQDLVSELEGILGNSEMTTYEKDNTMQRFDFDYKGRIIDFKGLTDEQLWKADGIMVELTSTEKPGTYITISYSKMAPKRAWIFGMNLDEEQEQKIMEKYRQRTISEIVLTMFKKKQTA